MIHPENAGKVEIRSGSGKVLELEGEVVVVVVHNPKHYMEREVDGRVDVQKGLCSSFGGRIRVSEGCATALKVAFSCSRTGYNGVKQPT